MAEFISLDRLLSQGRPSSYLIAVADTAEQNLDFAAFSIQAARWRQAFKAHSGHKFALYFNNSATFAAALMGAWQAGKCVYLPGDALPSTLQRLRHEVDGFAGDLPSEYAPVQPRAAAIDQWNDLDLNAISLVVYTSGSSGEPSAIPKKLSQLSSEVAALHACFGRHSATVLATVSHQHIYGLLFRVLWPISAGYAFAADRLAFPEDIAAALSTTPDAVLVASPAHLKRLPEQLNWGKAASHLRMLFSSGGPLSTEALHLCRSLLRQAPIEVYGSSETGGIAWRARQQDVQTAWQTLPGVAVKVRDELLQVRSAHLSDDQWQACSDRVTLTDSGFELIGRSDRIIKIEEKRVSLNAIEDALLTTGLLQDARIVALKGARLTLGVVATPNTAGWHLFDTAGKRALNQQLRKTLALCVEASALPRRFRYLHALPTNSQSKVTETALAALFDPRRPEARVLSLSSNHALLAIDVKADSPFFDGHFTDSPVLPGVAQIEWALRLARELFDLPAVFLRLELIKFQQVITPDSRIQLELGTQAKANESVLTFKFLSTAGPHASGKIVLGAHP
ncbi:AMP-binding protein [Iodobacter sp.]|uniref:AMP-binding protein n=1 Tax=Iodobacter sp. TaxID=1915058 RepID=UPI0025FB9C0A|nr:AMP-binding protein [Iodobacter sp.]